MNYVTVSSPVRLSLLGGSSDLDSYLQKHGRGSVISFTPNLYTYVSVYRDSLGRNNLDNKYIVNYSKREEISCAEDIQNELVREFFVEYKCRPCSIHMTSDVFSHGSGLAVSSSYACSISAAIHEFNENILSPLEYGLLAHKIEKRINPLLGQQDVFGCCVGGFKKIEFTSDGLPKYTFLPTNIFNHYDVYLIYTGITRCSTEVLKTVSVPQKDTFNPLVQQAEQCILSEDFLSFMQLMRDGWKEKKSTSDQIIRYQELKDMDEWLSGFHNCAAYKLCGAGNGGFFMCFFESGSSPGDPRFRKVKLSPHGVRRLI